VHFVEPLGASAFSFPPRAVELAERYAQLENRLRDAIDAVTSVVCPDCAMPCCRVHYCRETARNPWYRFVNRVAGPFAIPADWSTRRDAFGLGPRGCGIRAGRYVFCYSFNCRRLLEALGKDGRQAFQELSDLLLAVNRLPRGRLLHELRCAEEMSAEDLESVSRALADACSRLQDLLPGRGPGDRTASPLTPQADGRLAS